MDNIKEKTFSSAIWKFMERFLAQLVSLVVSVCIARILLPSDYVVVSLVTIFFNFSNVLISGGLNTALIQKKDPDAADYSTIFFLSLGISVLVYLVLFFAAPFIAAIYKVELMIPVLRVMGLILPVNAVKSIYSAYISSRLEFRKFFWATLGGTLISAFVGIYMALHGYGSWALVAQQMTNTCMDTLILIIVTRVPIERTFNVEKLKSLWSYGWKILVTSLINTLYTEINPLIVGLKFSGPDLSFYTKGKSFPMLISSSFTYTLSSVLFPALSKFQDEKDKVLALTRRYMQVVSYLVFPVMLGLFAVSDSFVGVILTEKWMPAAQFIRVFSVAFMFDVVTVGNCETIKAIGRSDVFLVIEIIKKCCYFVIIGVFVFFSKSAEQMAYATVVCSVVAIIVNSIPNIRLIGYRIPMLIEDLIFNFITSVVMCAGVMAIGRFVPVKGLLMLVLQLLAGVVIYGVLSIVTRNRNLNYIWNVIVLKRLKKQG